MIPVGLNPAQVLDLADPGDDTMRNFRYQLQYGIVLAIHAILKKSNNYVSIYCEHHDDFLCELPNGLFDAVQVKSRKKENGAWQITHDDILKTIHRFYKLTMQFPGLIAGYHVVSNAEYLDYNGLDEQKIAQCPKKFCDAVQSGLPQDHVNLFIGKNYKKLKKYFSDNNTKKVDDTVLCALMGKIQWNQGPDRDSFYEYIVASHMPQLPGVKQWSITKVGAVVKQLLMLVLEASSKLDSAPDQWTTIGLANAGNTSAILHKQLIVEDIKSFINACGADGGNLAPYFVSQSLVSGTQPDTGLPIMRKKMLAGGLEAKHIDRIKAFARAADDELIELGYQPGVDLSTLQVIEGLVEEACDRAEIAANPNGDSPIYGRLMLHFVNQYLRELERDRASQIHNRKSECLLGIVGQLTEDCRVWWSAKFDVNAA
jgi:hypothetical protein